jgi:hypothetical protein
LMRPLWRKTERHLGNAGAIVKRAGGEQGLLAHQPLPAEDSSIGRLAMSAAPSVPSSR